MARGHGWVGPTRRAAGAVAAVAVAVVFFGGAATFTALALGLVLALFVADALVLLVAAPSATAARTVKATVPLLAPTAFSLSVSVAGPVSVRRLRQPVPPALALVPDEARGGELAGTLTGRARGQHTLSPAVVRLTGPVGFANRDVAVLPATTIRVIPDLPRARRRAAARRGAGTEEGRLRNRLGVGTEFESIREYAPDDDVRQVNWIATSRCGRPMTNLYRVDENRDVICVVDAGRLMAAPIGPLSRLDVALDAATVLSVEADAALDRVGAVAFADTVVAQLRPRRHGAAAVVEALYDLEPTEVESDYERAFVVVGRHKRALVVVFTDLVDETASRSLRAACAVLARRHAVVVATCADPDLAAAVTAEPTDVTGVFAATVARDLLARRDRAAAQLRALGVTVVEAPADRLGAAAVVAYRALKARARV